MIRISDSGSQALLDIERPNAARICDYLLDGASNFAADRKIARRLIGLDPRMPLYARANRHFVRWAVQALTVARVEQFIDLGPGVTPVGSVHKIAQAVNPQARTVYVDIDPMVIQFWRALLVDDPLSTAVCGDLRDPHAVLTDPAVRSLINTDLPLAVVAAGVLHFVPDADHPGRIVKQIRAGLAPGSYLAISHAIPPAEAEDAYTAELLAAYEATATPLTLRTAADVAALLDGWEPVRPVAALDEWLEPSAPVPAVAAVGRLP